MKKVIILLVLAIILSVVAGWDRGGPQLPSRATPTFLPVSPLTNQSYLFLPLVEK